MLRRFEWDDAKAGINWRKHGVTFEVAARAFADPSALTAPEREVWGEVRWQTLGLIEGNLMLVVAHTVNEISERRQTIEVLRIISARRADRKERQRYEQEIRFV